jgi:hypothetical protein
MVKAIVQGILGGMVILAVLYVLHRAGQPRTPSVFYPYNHHPAVHPIRWFPRRYGH